MEESTDGNRNNLGSLRKVKLTDGRMIWDIALALLVGALLAGEALAEGPEAGAVVLATSMGLLLVGRRHFPLSTYIAGSIALLSIATFYYPAGYYPVANIIALHAVGAYATRVRSIVGLVLGVGAVTAYWLIVPPVPLPALPSIVAGSWMLAWVAGQADAGRRRRALEAEQRAEDAERARRAEVAHAAAEERTRIAREVHDVVGHSVNVMMLQAGAARRILEKDPGAGRDALERVELVGRDALDELDRVLGLLKEDDQNQPLPGVDDLDELVGHFSAAGVPVEMSVELDGAEVSPTVGLTVYRTIQEALTNVAKYAGGAPATVSITSDDNHLELSVVDRGSESQGMGSGRGLVGMRERVEMLGGTITAGPEDGGGWAVRCTVPLTP